MILQEVFSEQPPGFIFIAWKERSGKWHDRAFPSVDDAERFIAALQDCDIYFSPTTYSRDERKKPYVQPSKWLWQDLDAVDPRSISPVPTIAWESSPGRYQALWKMDQLHSPAEAEIINKRLAQQVKADHGSWILTKVLRIPGTKNYKYSDIPTGKLLWRDGPVYSPQALPSSVQDLLTMQSPEGRDRSNTLWFMEHELAKAGFTIDEIYAIVKDSIWNKYKGRSDEEQRLMHEIALALKDHKPKISDLCKLRITRHAEIMGNDESNPGWLIEGWWTRNSHGIVAGEPKSWKSTLAMDAAISIASGKPFLGEFDVKEQGPVIIIQNENAEWIIRERMSAISVHRGLGGVVEPAVDTPHFSGEWPIDLPIYYINNQAFSLTNEAHVELLEKLIQEIKPVLIILDPLYLMFDGDINSAKDLNPSLSLLIGLKHKYNVSIMLIHHWRKSQGSTKRGGQRMLGSTTLHGWVESAWYVQSGEEITVEREFRSAQAPREIKMRMSLGDIEDSQYTVEILDDSEKAQDEILSYLEQHKEAKISVIAKDLGLNERLVKRKLEALISAGQVSLEGKRYSLAPQTP